jgi:hypothetical protein
MHVVYLIVFKADKVKKLQYLILSIISVSLSCTEKQEPNPFDNVNGIHTVGLNPTELPEGSFGWLHQKVFKPTCANSGCHDGTFEPDFRTIESSYSTLVNQPIIKNNPAGTFTKRVIPGSANQSVLVERLINDIDGISGIMPLSVDSSSDWPVKKDFYINHIKNWINSGALNAYGQAPQAVNMPPVCIGAQARIAGSSVFFQREIGNAEIKIPAGTAQFELLFALADDNSAYNQLITDSVRLSLLVNSFGAPIGFNLSPLNQTIQAIGMGGTNVTYTHKAIITTTELSAGIYYFRIKVKDSPTTNFAEIPNSTFADHIKNYFSLKIE